MLAELETQHTLETQTLWQQFSVTYEYAVCFAEDIFNTENRTLLDCLSAKEPEKQHKALVIVDQTLSDNQPELVADIVQYFNHHKNSLSLIDSPRCLPGGEIIKSDSVQQQKLQRLIAKHNIDRHSYIIAIGGGALLDAVGLASAIAHRGIRHIRIPTTVLAQNDSGVGVKNGINFFGQKNYLGTFAPPFAVINDYRFIRSLPERDKIAGMAEAVKVALIRDSEFFTWLESNASALREFDQTAMKYMIKRCAELHMHQIAKGGDPFETGSARPLDFGHWAAHELECLTRYEMRHGEAVAIGISLDTCYSVISGLIDKAVFTRVTTLLQQLGFTLWHEALASRDEDNNSALLQGLSRFKEHLGGDLTITLLQAIGYGIEVNTMKHSWVEVCIQQLKNQFRKPAQLLILPFYGESSACSNQESGKDEKVTINAAHGPNPKQDSSLTTETHDLAFNQQAVISHLQCWLERSLAKQEMRWLDKRLSLLEGTINQRELDITMGLIPRKIGRKALSISPDDMRTAQIDSKRAWQTTHWTLDTTARCLVICLLQQRNPDVFDQLYPDLCNHADLAESLALYRFSAVLNPTDAVNKQIGVGLRTHVKAIFESIAHNNPYPRQNFDQNRWNHMILKALFIDTTLWQIDGIDEKGNLELATILIDYAHERWAAHREVSPELWRCVGPFATIDMYNDLERCMHSANLIEQQAGLLALEANPDYQFKSLNAQQKQFLSDIRAGEIDWLKIAQAWNQKSH